MYKSKAVDREKGWLQGGRGGRVPLGQHTHAARHHATAHNRTQDRPTCGQRHLPDALSIDVLSSIHSLVRPGMGVHPHCRTHFHLPLHLLCWTYLSLHARTTACTPELG